MIDQLIKKEDNPDKIEKTRIFLTKGIVYDIILTSAAADGIC